MCDYQVKIGRVDIHLSLHYKILADRKDHLLLDTLGIQFFGQEDTWTMIHCTLRTDHMVLATLYTLFLQ